MTDEQITHAARAICAAQADKQDNGDSAAALRQPTQSDALREALERIGVGMMPPEIIEGKLTLRLMRVDIAQEQSK